MLGDEKWPLPHRWRPRMKNLFQKVIIALTVGTALYASSFIKFSLMLGGYQGYFSLANVAWPLAAALFPSRLIFSLLIALVSLKLVGASSVPLMSITFGIPTLAAVLSIKGFHAPVRNLTVHVLLPAACMALFIMHPAGTQAAPYALYWFIPIFIWAAGRRSIPANALAATFVAHAVGSVLWIYTLPTTTELWIQLIPVVAFERFTIAALISLLYSSISAIVSYIEHINLEN